MRQAAGVAARGSWVRTRLLFNDLSGATKTRIGIKPVERLEPLELLERLEPGQWIRGEAKWNVWNGSAGWQ